MTPSDQTLPDTTQPSESPAYLYIDQQNVVIQRLWTVFGCAAPVVLFWLGALLCGALVGW